MLSVVYKQEIAEEERDFGTTEPALTFLQHVSEGMCGVCLVMSNILITCCWFEDSELRDVSCAVDKELSEFSVEMRYATAHRNIQCTICMPVNTIKSSL